MSVSDLLLGWLDEDGYSLGESGWVNSLIAQQPSFESNGPCGQNGGLRSDNWQI